MLHLHVRLQEHVLLVPSLGFGLRGLLRHRLLRLLCRARHVVVVAEHVDHAICADGRRVAVRGRGRFLLLHGHRTWICRLVQRRIIRLIVVNRRVCDGASGPRLHCFHRDHLDSN